MLGPCSPERPRVRRGGFQEHPGMFLRRKKARGVGYRFARPRRGLRASRPRNTGNSSPLARRYPIARAVRIGTNSGPFMGRIGTKKFAYDLWGETVNRASRMESHGQPRRIQLIESTRKRLGEKFGSEGRAGSKSEIPNPCACSPSPTPAPHRPGLDRSCAPKDRSKNGSLNRPTTGRRSSKVEPA